MGTNNFIINNLFEFWEHIGTQGNFFYKTEDYSCTLAPNFSWPSRIFDISNNISKSSLKDIYLKMKLGKLPMIFSTSEDEKVEKQLLEQNFVRHPTSVKAMWLDISDKSKSDGDFSNIEPVNNDVKSVEFAKIASQSFGQEILPSTIIGLTQGSSKVKMYIQNYNNAYVSCGMVFLDKNGDSGLHMIATLDKCRGLGLGKIMTNKLLVEAHKNLSKRVVLVASEGGERIYSKLSFKTEGALIGYSV